LICTDAFIWLAHQKLDQPENCSCYFRNGGAIDPIAPPVYAPDSLALRRPCLKLSFSLVCKIQKNSLGQRCTPRASERKFTRRYGHPHWAPDLQGHYKNFYSLFVH